MEVIRANLIKCIVYKEVKSYLVSANIALEEWEFSVVISYSLSNAEHPDKEVKFPKF